MAWYNVMSLWQIEDKFETDNLIGQVDLEKHVPNFEYEKCIITGWNQVCIKVLFANLVLIFTFIKI